MSKTSEQKKTIVRSFNSFVPLAIRCLHCDAGDSENLAQAVANGWTEIEEDDGFSWNHLGVCPACQEYHYNVYS